MQRAVPKREGVVVVTRVRVTTAKYSLNHVIRGFFRGTYQVRIIAGLIKIVRYLQLSDFNPYIQAPHRSVSSTKGMMTRQDCES